MKLNFIKKDIDYSVKTILEFTSEENTGYWADPFFKFYPDIDRLHFYNLGQQEKANYLTNYFKIFQQENKNIIDEKLEKYNEHWNKNAASIINALEDAFEIKLDDILNDLIGVISFCPICPRYLAQNRFDVFYLNSERGALGLSIHEIIHFVWFYVWNNIFQDDPKEYETPHLKWILSEMVVDCIMQDKRLSEINPYFKDGCVYSYFYTLDIEEKNILKTLGEMYASMDIKAFMKRSYAYCKTHESAIRAHIKRSES